MKTQSTSLESVLQTLYEENGVAISLDEAGEAAKNILGFFDVLASWESHKVDARSVSKNASVKQKEQKDD